MADEVIDTDGREVDELAAEIARRWRANQAS
jgi:hypothetical protein